MSAPRRSSAPKTENRIYLELYRLSSERKRVDSELKSVRARLTALEQKRHLLDKQQRDLEVLLGKTEASSGGSSDGSSGSNGGGSRGRFVLEYWAQSHLSSCVSSWAGCAAKLCSKSARSLLAVRVWLSI